MPCLAWPYRRQVKLSDFGISGFVKLDNMGGDFLTSTGGSLTFFAPEMCRTLKGAGYSGRAADLWACGCSLFMWMYHRLPYEADNPPALLAMIAEEPVAFPPNERGHSAELLARQLQLAEERQREKRMAASKTQSYDSHVFLGTSVGQDLCCVCPALQQWVSAELQKEAAILKERRKAREERQGVRG